MIEQHEFRLFAISDPGAEGQRRGMGLHLSIRDAGTPGPEFEKRWPAHSNRLRQRLDVGENIVADCRGLLGRAGMISARLLVEFGDDFC